MPKVCETLKDLRAELAARPRGGVEVRAKLIHQLAADVKRVGDDDDVADSIELTCESVPANRLPVILSREVANRLAGIDVPVADQAVEVDADEPDDESADDESEAEDDVEESEPGTLPISA